MFQEIQGLLHTGGYRRLRGQWVKEHQRKQRDGAREGDPCVGEDLQEKEGGKRSHQWWVCREPSCKAVVNRLSQHLQCRKHGLTDPGDIARARKRMRLAKLSEFP